MILLLHTLIEGIVALLFLFYPGAGDLVPGFGTSEGRSFEMLMKMYGLAAAFLAALSLTTWFSRANRVLVLTVTGLLTFFHLGMTIVQAVYNDDSRAMLLHFLLMIFMGGVYVQERRKAWGEEKAR